LPFYCSDPLSRLVYLTPQRADELPVCSCFPCVDAIAFRLSVHTIKTQTDINAG
jgi:hypothetical protein